jgi:hypothetical protein
MSRIKHFLETKTVAFAAAFFLGVAVLAPLTGCVGYVDGGGVAVVAAAPDVYLFGGGYDRGRDVHVFSNRGHASIDVAHGGGGHGGHR